MGKAYALTFAEAGADVAVADVVANDGMLDSVAKQIRKCGRRSLAGQVDISKKTDINSFIREVMAEFGTIDIWANVAVRYHSSGLLSLNEQDWDVLTDTNLKGYWLACQAIAPIMVERKKGSIINMTSQAGVEMENYGQKNYVNSDTDMTASIQRVESGLVPFGEGLQPQWNERAELTDRMRHYSVPGVSYAVIEGYEIAWAEGHGTLRSDGDTHVTSMTLFHAGSNAKLVSAAASLKLVQQGRLALDEDVNDRLRSWHIPDGEFTQYEKVTLRRLLSHSGGLEDGFTNRSSGDPVPKYFTPAGVAPSVTIQQLLDAEPGIDVDGPTRVTVIPGSQYRYANADYAILELLIRDVTDKPFPTFMRETILRPLGMSSSTYEQPLPPDLRARAAIEHDHSGEAFAGDRLHVPLLAAGSLWTTPSDMARFIIEMMDNYRGKSRRILSRTMASEMFSKQIEIHQDPLADAAGLGFQLSGKGKDLCVVHTGGTWGSTSIVCAYPETGQGAIIMTNSATGSLLRIEILLGIARAFGWPLEP